MKRTMFKPRLAANGNKIDKAALVIKISCTSFKRLMYVKFMSCDQGDLPREKALTVDRTFL